MPQECINIYMAHLLALNIWLIMDIVKKLGMTPKEIILNFFEIGILFSVLIINHGIYSGGSAVELKHMHFAFNDCQKGVVELS